MLPSCFPTAWADCAIATISRRKLVSSGLPLSSQIIQEEILTSKSLEGEIRPPSSDPNCVMADETHSIQLSPPHAPQACPATLNGSTDGRELGLPLRCSVRTRIRYSPNVYWELSHSSEANPSRKNQRGKIAIWRYHEQ